MSPSNMKLLHAEKQDQMRLEAKFKSPNALHRHDTIQEEIPASQTIEMEVEYVDVLQNSTFEMEDFLSEI